MMILRLTACMLALFFSLFDTRPLSAHEGHAHVKDTVTAVSEGQLVVQTQGGQTVTIQTDRNTRYRATSMKTSSGMVRVGDRVVVEVTGEINSLRAAEVRYAAVTPNTP